MALVTITEASKLAGKSRRTIQRHIDAGKLSKTIDEQGNPKIDTSEILRVYGSIKKEDVAPVKGASKSQIDTSNIRNDVSSVTKQEMEIALLKKELELTKKLLEEKDNRNKDLQNALLLIENKIVADVTKKDDTPQKKWWQIFK
ncbi:MAG: hypothetical protein N4Q32_00080 [Neisseriaceae bacterium]|nr:hypothetical protein [Neisseriaceae bacterium]